MKACDQVAKCWQPIITGHSSQESGLPELLN